MLVLWGVVQWLALVALNNWLAPQRDLSHAANAAYADSITGFTHGMLTASTSLWYLYALIVYFVLCKIFSRWAAPLLALFVVLSVAINFVPTPWWGMNSVIRNLPLVQPRCMVWRNADGMDQGGASAPPCGHCSG